jgi:hypothetical protein
MSDAESVKDAREQLAIVLSFFSRVDSKLSTVLAVDIGMLAALSAGVPNIKDLSVWSVIARWDYKSAAAFGGIRIYYKWGARLVLPS